MLLATGRVQGVHFTMALVWRALMGRGGGQHGGAGRLMAHCQRVGPLPGERLSLSPGFAVCSSSSSSEVKGGAKGSSMSVYILRSEAPGSNATYCGLTRQSAKHRLKQHNGELKSGAKATLMNRPWAILCVLDGFPSDRAARQCEWRLKHLDGKRKPGRKAVFTGPAGRVRALNHILCTSDRWTTNGEPIADHKLRIRVCMSVSDWLMKEDIALLHGEAIKVVAKAMENHGCPG